MMPPPSSYLSTPSPNFDARTAPPDMIVLHYTGMPTGEAALERLRDPAAKVSAHYLVEEDGRVFALVPEERRAWHAGVSSWRGETDINGRSIGDRDRQPRPRVRLPRLPRHPDRGRDRPADRHPRPLDHPRRPDPRPLRRRPDAQTGPRRTFPVEDPGRSRPRPVGRPVPSSGASARTTKAWASSSCRTPWLGYGLRHRPLRRRQAARHSLPAPLGAASGGRPRRPTRRLMLRGKKV